MIPYFLLLFLAFAPPCFGQKAPPAQNFQKLENCTYVDNKWNDGDSFHVQSDREFIFRIYFVDTPESESCSQNSPISTIILEYCCISPSKKGATYITEEKQKKKKKYF